MPSTENAAIGISVHSGWGALVAVTADGNGLKVLHRARVEITGNEIPGWKQPYHHAENLSLPEAQRHIGNCARASSQLAVRALSEIAERLRAAKFRVMGSAILLASARPLPDLASILKAHPLIHTAEGEFFRRIFWDACCEVEIPSAGFRMRDLSAQAAAILGRAASAKLQRDIQTLGKSIGPPWTSDHKNAALAASLVLLGDRRKIRAYSQEPAIPHDRNFAACHPERGFSP
jgi:hypothetical protein